MQERLNKICSETNGQITVYLSLIFIILMGLSLCVLGGMRLYSEVALSEEAFIEAGNYVLSHYNRPLFERYHVFFLDPKEREQIISDGEEYLGKYLDKSSGFAFRCDNLTLTEEKTAVDEDGLYLKHQIREWMKYGEIENAEAGIKNLFESMTDVSQKKDSMQKEMEEAGKEKANGEEVTSSEQGESERSDSPDVPRKEGMQWKELKEMLEQIGKAGILCYVTDDLNQLSGLSISGQDLPSQKEGIGKEGILDFPLSISDSGGWKDIFASYDFGEPDVHFLSDEYFLSRYVLEHFDCYVDEHDENAAWTHALKYEIEYLAGGRTSDRENLKLVANRMVLLRFIMNYSFASGNAEINGKIGTMADLLSGAFGLPAAREAVRILLLSALSYGESLIEVHTLFSGGEISAVKDISTWNLYFYNAAEMLKNKGPVKTGKRNVNYEDYLQLLLSMKVKANKVYYRMMDLMQLNIQLEQPDFLMEDCIFRFRWKADMKCMMGKESYLVPMDRVNSY